ncbi:MAG: hypothetical protein ACI4KF_05880 [Huintestinicola sp.]
MGVKSLFKDLLSSKGHYNGSVKILAEEGYSDRYMECLEKELSTASKKKDIAEGKAFFAQALLFRGELKKAEKAFADVDSSELPKHVDSVFFNNYIVCLFLMGGEGHMKQISQIYDEHNHTLLSDPTLVMRRTVGIHEFIEKRYENAVTVFIKLLSEPDSRLTLYADICLVKTLLALDMYERAKEIADAGFPRYKKTGEISEEIRRLNTRINAGDLRSGKKGKKRK